MILVKTIGVGDHKKYDSALESDKDGVVCNSRSKSTCNLSRGYKHKSLEIDYTCEQNIRNKASQLKILNLRIFSIENVPGNKY